MNELPFGLSFAAPAFVEAIPLLEREKRVLLEEDLCEIDGELFFVRARVQLPVADGGPEAPAFEWRVWISVSAAAYVRLASLQPQESLPPASLGFLASRLPGYEDTLDLRGRLHPQPEGLPLFVLGDNAHRLEDEQRDGVSIEQVRGFMRLASHPE